MNGRLLPGGPDQVPAPGRYLYGVEPWWIHVVELLIVVAAIIAVVLILRAVLRSPRVTQHQASSMANPALAELDLRYARGEIDRDDYLTRRADLLGAAQPTAPLPPAAPEPPRPAAPPG